MYGLGAPWTYTDSKNFDKYKICGKESPCVSVEPTFGNDHYR